MIQGRVMPVGIGTAAATSYLKNDCKPNQTTEELFAKQTGDGYLACKAPEMLNRRPPVTRIIWMFWDKGENSSMTQFNTTNEPIKGIAAKDGELRRMAIDGWRRLNPNWQVRVLDVALATKLSPAFKRAMAKRPPFNTCIQLQADLLRTELLSLYGGVWVDTSTVPVQPLDAYIEVRLGLLERLAKCLH